MLLLKILPLLGLVSALTESRAWALKQKGCKDGSDWDWTTWWLDPSMHCVVLKKRLLNPFKEGVITYQSLCCLAYLLDPNKHPKRVGYNCNYTPKTLEEINDEMDCVSTEVNETGDCAWVVGYGIVNDHAPSGTAIGCTVSNL